ncbi:MAG: exo-alpha-sialidase [Clostridia bacterium]|nr:exo-alpha-sialidase [Clostridia bacterium]
MISNIRQVFREANDGFEFYYTHQYDKSGNLIERKFGSAECDYMSAAWHRVSTDNGKTWGEWITDLNDAEDGRKGMIPYGDDEDQELGEIREPDFYDEDSGCTIGISNINYIIRGHAVGYFEKWKYGCDYDFYHSYFSFRKPNGELVTRLIRFEEGPEYRSAPRDMEYLKKNRVLIATLDHPDQSSPFLRAPDGTLIFLAFPSMRLCCKLAGVDVNRYFPSCPDLVSGLLVGHLKWIPEKEDYEITYSNPIMVSDMQSSRGVAEPVIAFLPSGRWVIAYRGSNKKLTQWNARIDPKTPGFKWFTYSDDCGKTWSVSMPWHFDTQEVVYSSASFSATFRSSKTGDWYWVGNICEPSSIYGNDPRNTLHICQIDPTYGHLIKDTLRVIDTRREGEGPQTELSNFNLFENRETKELEIRLSKCNMHEGTEQIKGDWYGEAWEYYISFE